jgi:hypothetical protein
MLQSRLEEKMRRLFNYYDVCMDINETKISIIDSKFNIKEYHFDIELTADILSNVKNLTELVIKKIPYSFIKPRIMIRVPGDINKEYLYKITEIIYKCGKRKFREIITLDEKISIINVFNELNRCVYLVQMKNGIYGFASCAGEAITAGVLFDFNITIEEMIFQINHEVPQNILNELKIKLKKYDIDLDSLWSNDKIILSLEPSYYYNKSINSKMEIINNNYIPDILYKGLIICAKKYYNKIF